MNILYPVLLYLGGIFISSAFLRSVSMSLLAWTGFLWGSLIWTLGGVTSLILDTSFSVTWMLIWCFVWILVAVFLHIRYPRAAYDIGSIVYIAVSFIILILLSGVMQFGTVSFDSLAQLILANELADKKISIEMLQQLGLWGVMLPVLHAPAFWFGTTVFVTIQAGFVFSILGNLSYLVFISLNPVFKWFRLLITTLTPLLLITSYFILFQAAYIHNNILASAYLLPAVVFLWIAHKNNEGSLLFPALLLFLGFGLTRTESVLFAAMFIFFAITYGQFTPKLWRQSLLPYTIVLLSWYIWLLIFIKPDTFILTPERILILILAIIGTGLSPIILGILDTPTQHSHISKLALWFMIVVLLLLIMIEPQHMILSIFNSSSNLFLTGISWWGAVWIFCLFALILLHNTKMIYERIFTFSIVGFFLMVWLLGFPRSPYRLGWGDSANRIFIHILPIIMFYVSIKINCLLESICLTEAS